MISVYSTSKCYSRKYSNYFDNKTPYSWSIYTLWAVCVWSVQIRSWRWKTFLMQGATATPAQLRDPGAAAHGAGLSPLTPLWKLHWGTAPALSAPGSQQHTSSCVGQARASSSLPSATDGFFRRAHSCPHEQKVHLQCHQQIKISLIC